MYFADKLTLNMKKLYTTLFLAMLFSFASIAIKPIKPVSSTKTSTDNPTSIHVNQSDFDALTAAFQSKYPKATFGGSVGKQDLQNLIQSMPAGSKFVNFHFCTDPTFNKTSVAFMGAKTAEEPVSEIVCLRNGNNETAFCPTACDMASPSNNTTVSITYADYESLAATYQSNFPKRTQGGNIDKEALQEIINSLPAEVGQINFRFCTDDSVNKTSIIFVGGTANGSVLYIRNGGSADSFCPTNCNRN